VVRGRGPAAFLCIEILRFQHCLSKSLSFSYCVFLELLSESMDHKRGCGSELFTLLSGFLCVC
jgi:hypothetical protein